MRLPRSVSTRLRGDYRVRRLARRAGRGFEQRRQVVPDRPVGGKFELTYACNLRCDFCYTDSPRRTLERATDLSDDAWRQVIDEAIELGIIEAVVTGGEPLLRRDLTLEIVERLSSAGVAVSLNTNGWFVDEAVADRLASLSNLTVHISIDGPTPEIHDAARGVPGSWRRAVRAIDLLIARGVDHSVNHVITPLNQAAVPQFLEQMWLLGVTLVRMTPVVLAGAASRVDGWEIDRAALRKLADDAPARYGEEFGVLLQTGDVEQIAYQDVRVPGVFLVRPNGAVRLDSITPFSFGRVEDGLASCWRRIAADWRHQDILDWAGGMKSASDLGEAAVVPYADDEVEVGAGRLARARAKLAPRLPKRGADSTVPPPDAGDVAAARAAVVDRLRGRRHRAAPLRWAGSQDDERLVRLISNGKVFRLSRTAGQLLDALDGATVGEALDELAARYPGVAPATLERDTVGILRWLVARGVLQPEGKPARVAAEAREPVPVGGP